jgi:hypothetical protein
MDNDSHKEPRRKTDFFKASECEYVILFFDDIMKDIITNKVKKR